MREPRHPGVADGTGRGANGARHCHREDTDHGGEQQRRKDSGSEEVGSADAQSAQQADKNESQREEQRELVIERDIDRGDREGGYVSKQDDAAPRDSVTQARVQTRTLAPSM
jgi:hypothetical protein